MISRPDTPAYAESARLPVLYRVAAGARRALRDSGTSAVYRSRLARPLRRLLSSAAPRGMRLVEVCGGELAGARLWLDLSCEKFYWLGTHEEHVQRALVAHVRTGAVVYDVGAHAGFFSLLAARLVGPRGHIVAFEPLAANVERLRANAAANAAANIEVGAIALGDSDGEAQFSLHESSLEGSLDGAADADAITVPVRTLDGMVREGAPPPALIKMDVEGAEGRVLRGARETIAAHRPVLVLEVHSDAAAREVAAALPIPYRFVELCSGRETSADALMAAHYLAMPVVGGKD